MHEGAPDKHSTPQAEKGEVSASTLAELLQEITDDQELVEFFSNSSDLPLNPDGTSSIARDPFQLVSHFAKHDEEKAHRFVDLLAEAGFLPELHYEYQSEGLNEAELAHTLNLKRFESARENFNNTEHSPLEKAIIDRSIEHLASVRASYGLKPLVHVEQYVSLKTEPLSTKDEGLGITVPDTPIVIVRTPDEISTLKMTFHELTHIHAFSRCTFSKDADGDIDTSFSKIGISSTVGFDEDGRPQRNFKSLNEAVTEEFTKRFMQGISDTDDDFGEIIRDQRSKIEEYRKEHPDTFTEEGWSDVLAIHELPDGTLYPVQCTYREERQVLEQILMEMSYRLHPAYPEKNSNEIKEQLFQELLKSTFTGDITSFKDSFIKAFGEDAYRQYASSTSLEEDVEVLTKIGIPNLDGLQDRKEL